MNIELKKVEEDGEQIKQEQCPLRRYVVGRVMIEGIMIITRAYSGIKDCLKSKRQKRTG